MTVYPNFLVLGAAKCGTTSLCTWLSSHPDLLISTPKEPVFFELEYARGLEYYGDTYFAEWRGERAVGEGRVYNLFLPYVPARIRDSLPDARFIVILRDPVERAHSHWWHRVTRGYERRSFVAAIAEELDSIVDGREFEPKRDESSWRANVFPGAEGLHTADLKRVPYVEMGHYATQLARYFALFPGEHIRVLFLDDLKLRQEELLRELWDFLGIEPEVEVTDGEPRNVAQETIKSPLTFALERLSWATGAHRLVPTRVRAAIRSVLPSSAAEKPEIQQGLEQRLRRHYAPLDEDLAGLMGRPVPWAGVE